MRRSCRSAAGGSAALVASFAGGRCAATATERDFEDAGAAPVGSPGGVGAMAERVAVGVGDGEPGFGHPGDSDLPHRGDGDVETVSRP